MKDIEELARSVFEDAEQEPPREVWDGIEARLQSQAVAGKSRAHRWMWPAVAGVVVAGALCFGLTREQAPEESYEQATYVDSVAPEIVVAKNTVTVETPEKEEVVRVPKPTEATCSEPRAVSSSKVSSSDVNDDEENEKVFDLLEYQLRTHEYDIPNEVQQPAASQPKRDLAPDQSTTQKEVGKPSKTEAPIEISIVIPNLLTPNGDGYNDCWAIPDLVKYGRASVQIYTAQSKRVFVSDNYHGEFCGDDMPSGNYFYVLSIPEHNYTRRGVLVIKR